MSQVPLSCRKQPLAEAAAATRSDAWTTEPRAVTRNLPPTGLYIIRRRARNGRQDANQALGEELREGGLKCSIRRGPLVRFDGGLTARRRGLRQILGRSAKLLPFHGISRIFMTLRNAAKCFSAR
jgi:hypothetical protein